MRLVAKAERKAANAKLNEAGKLFDELGLSEHAA